MPDVSRSDYQRSDASQSRPRVFFNRDVHVKRIVPRQIQPIESNRGNISQPIRLPLRKEQPHKSHRQLKEEAAKVLNDVEKIECVISSNKGAPHERFYTLPNRKKPKSDVETLSEAVNRTDHLELDNTPRKPPRNFQTPHNNTKPSIFDIFGKSDRSRPKKSNLRRTLSDATNLKSKAIHQKETDGVRVNARSDTEDFQNSKPTPAKKQLSPISERHQRDGYHWNLNENKENDTLNKINTETKPKLIRKWQKLENEGSSTESLKKYIENEDLKETGIRIQPKNVDPEVIIIDLNEAKEISGPKQSKSSVLGKKLKFLTIQKGGEEHKGRERKVINEKHKLESGPSGSRTAKIKQTMTHFKKPEQTHFDMIHSSQQPVDKPPLTKGRTVDTMVKRLSSDSSSLPPKTQMLISPNMALQHNNNQPFSYTRGLSPDKYNGNEPSSPVIYAQVVCANGDSGPSKQTIHMAYPTNTKKNHTFTHSDSDEGLGYEEHFNRKYSPLEKYENKHISHIDRDEYLMEADEPPESTNLGTTYFSEHSYSKMFSDIERGRADGMDAKRRESLSDSLDNSSPKLKDGKSDWSARRDLLESRINRRIHDKIVSVSGTNNTNSYNRQSTSKPYRNESTSPVQLSDKYISDVQTNRFDGYRKDDVEYITNGRYPYEPKSIDSQINDYRSSPESRQFETSYNKINSRSGVKSSRQQRLTKDRTIYQSNPEIHQRLNQPYLEDSYHDSLRREKKQYRLNTALNSPNDKKDKFGDSGIENDFNRDSTDNFRREHRKMYGRSAESEDEGFASSLLITSERHHTEKALNATKPMDNYEYDAPYERESYEYKKNTPAFIARETTIDDGSYYDPIIDKDFQSQRRTTVVKKAEKETVKPGKKSGLEKVKQLFMSSKRKKDKQTMVAEEDLRSRYREYKGSIEQLDHRSKNKEVQDNYSKYDYRNRSRLPTPSPEPQKAGFSNGHISDSNASYSGWFKSLDRLSRRKSKKEEIDESLIYPEEVTTSKSAPSKNLRFFGDSLRQRTIYNRFLPDKTEPNKMKSQSSRDLHDISKEKRSYRQNNAMRQSNHKSMINITESDKKTDKSIKSNTKPPISPRSREPTKFEERNRRNKHEGSSLESSTEGDSSQQSQQSQRSVVYLHAATVGDIPGPRYLKLNSRAASREELTSNSSKMQPRVKTLNRSFSMLAPWKPKLRRENNMDIDYNQYPNPASASKNGKYEQKISRNGTGKNSSSSTLKKKAHETKRSNQNISTLSSRSKSKENVNSLQPLKRSKQEQTKSSSSTLYKKRDKLPRENSRYSREKEIASRSISVESLGGNNSRSSRKNRDDGREVNRSLSMPRNPERSAGWFTLGKK